jgi:tetratricopeptide (TPR) repeat protein
LKALLHGEFYGYMSCVVFDALSLNVSGDIHFGEGDLVGAVREYRHGLVIDKKNTNLLNSLGVTYALMNRNKEAQSCFKKVLAIDSKNFMALYNKGLGELSTGNHSAAAIDFEMALNSMRAEEETNGNVKDDLVYQYGRVCFLIGNHEKSIDMLTGWYDEKRNSPGRGKCCRYLGLSHYRLLHEREATVWLQRAVVFDEYDSEALNVLAELYYKKGQGNEIAFKLFEKSIELNDNDPSFFLRFGACLNRSGDSERALALLSRCVRKPAARHEAWYELAVAYKNLKQYSKARYYMKKLKTGRTVPSALRERAETLKL